MEKGKKNWKKMQRLSSKEEDDKNPFSLIRNGQLHVKRTDMSIIRGEREHKEDHRREEMEKNEERNDVVALNHKAKLVIL